MSNAYNVITLQVLLHIYSRPVNFPEDSEASKDAHQRLLRNGLIQNRGLEDYNWEVTEKGSFFVKHLLEVPFPIPQWVIPTT